MNDETYEQLRARQTKTLDALKSLRSVLEKLPEGVTLAYGDYIAGHPSDAREVLEKLREALKQADEAAAAILRTIY